MSSMVDLERERARLRTQIEKLQATAHPLRLRLQREGFVSKASPQVVEEVRVALREKDEQLQILETRLLQLRD
jgi:valyl-tRNA synthetase